MTNSSKSSGKLQPIDFYGMCIGFSILHFAIMMTCLVISAHVWAPIPSIEPPTDLIPNVCVWMAVVLAIPIGALFALGPPFYPLVVLPANSFLWGYCIAAAIYSHNKRLEPARLGNSDQQADADAEKHSPDDQCEDR